MSTFSLRCTPSRPMAIGAALSGVLALAMLPVASAEAAKVHVRSAASCVTPSHAARTARHSRRHHEPCRSHHEHATPSTGAANDTHTTSGATGGTDTRTGTVSGDKRPGSVPSSAAGRATTGTSAGVPQTSATSGSILPLATGACDSSALSSPFARFGDTNQYKLVPGGDFEGSTAGWSLGGGAHVVSGSEPFSATGSAGSHSLLLPAGASVRAPYSCVNASYPSLRVFAKTNSLLATVAVSLEYNNALGLVSIPVGVVTLSPNWQPSLPMLTLSAVGGLVSGGTANVAVRFTALLGSAQIDDVFIDPAMRR